jgi:hypothetical protein
MNENDPEYKKESVNTAMVIMNMFQEEIAGFKKEVEQVKNNQTNHQDKDDIQFGIVKDQNQEIIDALKGKTSKVTGFKENGLIDRLDTVILKVDDLSTYKKQQIAITKALGWTLGTLFTLSGLVIAWLELHRK